MQGMKRTILWDILCNYENPELQACDYPCSILEKSVLLAIDPLQLLESLKEPLYFPNKVPLLFKKTNHTLKEKSLAAHMPPHSHRGKSSSLHCDMQRADRKE
jgi:hypothetical protein